MVQWSELTASIEKNPEKGARVERLAVRAMEPVEVFRLEPLVQPTVSNTSVVPASAPAPNTSVLPASAPAPNTSVAPVPAPVKKARASGGREYDPIVLGIEVREPLYDDAPPQSKHKMECDEAIRLEGMVSTLYASQGGRSRGWTKTGLDDLIKPRCASGGNIRELDRAKRAFLWQLVREDKPLSAFLDFVCVAKKIRVAVWFEEDKQVFVYPAADPISVDEEDGQRITPLYHVDSSGRARNVNFGTPQDFIDFCENRGYVLLPPLSVTHSLAKLTLDELESVGTKLGMAAVEGKKDARINAIATYKLKQRLSSS